MRSFAALLALTTVFVISCAAPPEPVEEAPPIDLVAEEAAVKAVVDLWLDMWVEEDLAAFDQAFSHDDDMIIFGTDMAEYWVGYQAARESIELQLGVFEDTEGIVRNQDIKVHASGKVAWFTEMLDMKVTSGGDLYEMTGWFSGIMEKRGGTWKIVQFHASKPVDGQAVAY